MTYIMPLWPGQAPKPGAVRGLGGVHGGLAQVMTLIIYVIITYCYVY